MLQKEVGEGIIRAGQKVCMKIEIIDIKYP
jgi:hypothetical protein